MCAPGNRVYWACAHDVSTTCGPCPESTFTDEPNDLSECIKCTECDLKRGLRVSKACTRSSDTVCEPLERFFCTRRHKHTCRLAVQHSECRPGQYIIQAGTGSTDTVCADCTADTYSNGSFSSCKPHTKCEALGLTEINPGTQSSDSECGYTPAATAIAVGAIVTVIIITVISVLTIKHMRKRRRSHWSAVGGQIDAELSDNADDSFQTTQNRSSSLASSTPPSPTIYHG
ncbi:unnamed protein product [Leuciscus chuanchicus]